MHAEEEETHRYWK